MALFVPEFFIEELTKHEQTILKKTKKTKQELIELIEILKEIMIVPKKDYAGIEKAKQISPDENDVPYFALALKLNCHLWTNDKLLKSQKIVPVFFNKRNKRQTVETWTCRELNPVSQPCEGCVLPIHHRPTDCWKRCLFITFFLFSLFFVINSGNNRALPGLCPPLGGSGLN